MSLVALGAVSRPHGVRGQLRVHRYNAESTVLLERETVVLHQGERSSAVRILDARVHGKVLLVTFEGVDTREAAEALRGAELCVARDELPPLDDDEFYHFDLIGLEAVRADGSTIGKVSSVVQYPASECLLVEGPTRSWEIPLGDPYVGEIDLRSRRVTIHHLEDLE